MSAGQDIKRESVDVVSHQDDFGIGEAKKIHAPDEADIFLHENGYTQQYLNEQIADQVQNKRLLRRVDLIMLPLLCGTYVLQYVDKQAMSYGAVFDLLTSTNLTGDQYSWLSSIFYFGYLFAEYPWAYIAQKYPTGKVISSNIIAWGCILLITAACSNFTGLAICRFLLGCFEAPITPCFMMIVGMWYQRSEQPFRAGIFYCCNGIGSMTGGIITYCIGQQDSFSVWKAVFLLCGGVTVIWGIVMMIFLPDDIISARRFTKDEKALLVARGAVAHTGILNRDIKWYQIREALLDPQIWILFLFTLLNEMINGGTANFGKLIIKGIVKTPLLTIAYGIPQGAFQVFFILTAAFLASRLKNMRTVIMACYIVPTIIGASLLWKLPRTNHNGLLLGYYIIGSFVASLVLALQMPASNVGGYTKRVTATAFVFLAYCVGNIIGPHAFLASEAPTYPTGCKVIISCACGQIALAITLRILLISRNKKRDAAQSEAVVEESLLIGDLTDLENPNFRYVY